MEEDDKKIVVVFGSDQNSNVLEGKKLMQELGDVFFTATLHGELVENDDNAHKADGCTGNLHNYDLIILFECSRGVVPVDYTGEVTVCSYTDPNTMKEMQELTDLKVATSLSDLLFCIIQQNSKFYM